VAILSRVDGPIERVLVADGQDVKAGQPLIQIDPEPLRIQICMNEANLQRDVAKEEDARAKEGRGRSLLDLRLRARMDNRSHALWPGQFVAVRVSVGVDNDAIVVPSVAVQPGGRSAHADLSFVWRHTAVAVSRARPPRILP